jgi:hypothetical protein
MSPTERMLARWQEDIRLSRLARAELRRVIAENRRRLG